MPLTRAAWLRRASVERESLGSASQIPANDDYQPLETDRGLLLCAGSFGCYQETLREGGTGVREKAFTFFNSLISFRTDT
ncbi:hypothetical protein CTAM01_17373 [Colletotrichum tamarilloi]|uniref:Uncharacterized protein n=1 Tax=Colletotrichum tamarilloi TaxID=1209934 RepID=A0ABQ9QFW5_9PEZI|nr:uncharacterized protein CTAM01_17373 [Colletotrichum tamarilloi]KAK1446663.1 hypothetical protein CTAM01_17373 [Colletotrichum tamarilloi]